MRLQKHLHRHSFQEIQTQHGHSIQLTGLSGAATQKAPVARMRQFPLASGGGTAQQPHHLIPEARAFCWGKWPRLVFPWQLARRAGLKTCNLY
jgi:hypothetical protein